jgi:hypothetical protein
MSNQNYPFGFWPIGWNRGGPNAAEQIERPIQAGYGSNICKGDVVNLSSGYVVLGAPTNQSGAAGALVPGIFLDCRYIDRAGNTVYSSYWPAGNPNAGTAFILPIAGAPPQRFRVQSGNSQGSSYVITFADVGKNVDIIVGTQTIAGTYGTSGMMIDADTLVRNPTCGAYPFTIAGMYSDIAPFGTPGTDNTSVNNIVIVASNPFSVMGAGPNGR